MQTGGEAEVMKLRVFYTNPDDKPHTGSKHATSQLK